MLDRKQKPTKTEAEEAIRVLLEYAGEDPMREGLVETPDRVTRAYGEWFKGYAQDPMIHLKKTFEEIESYDDVVLVRDIDLVSMCEHHMAPIIGKVHVAYLPNKRVVGLSKIVRVVDAFAKRLQVQERLTAEIADTIYEGLDARAVAVLVEAEHFCMRTRGVAREGVVTVTKALRGEYAQGPARQEVLSLIQGTHR